MNTRTQTARALPGGRVSDEIVARTRFAIIASRAAKPQNAFDHWMALGAYANELGDLFFDCAIRRTSA